MDVGFYGDLGKKHFRQKKVGVGRATAFPEAEALGFF
jgi:hypothetical protein